MGTTILTHFLDGPSPWQDFSTVIQFCIKYSEAIGAQLNHANLVIQTFDEPQLGRVARGAIRHDAVPVPFDQGGKLLERPEPLPFELLLPAGKELAGSAFPAIGPELAERLLEQVGDGLPRVGPEQLPKRAADHQREIGAVGERRVALPLDEGAVLQGHPVVLGVTDLIHGVGQVTEDVELVEESGLRCLSLHRAEAHRRSFAEPR
jgi:hypothetical protein